MTFSPSRASRCMLMNSSAHAERRIAVTRIRRFADIGLQRTRKIADMGVTRRVALMVVDVFETIQVPGHQQERLPGRHGQGLQTLKLRDQAMPVEQTRQLVAVGQVCELLIRSIEFPKRRTYDGACQYHEGRE